MSRGRSVITTTLYHYGLKPLLFQIDPEIVHDAFIFIGEQLGNSRFLRQATEKLLSYDSKQLATKVSGIRFPNPIGLSAGFDYNGRLTGILPEVGFGFHTVGTVTLEPYEGNPKPRLGRLPLSQGLLVNKGLKSLGAHAVISQLEQKKLRIPTGVSIASTNRTFASQTAQIADITACFELFEASRLKHAYYELNISCPNTHGGEPFTTKQKLRSLLTAIEQLKLKKPVFIKMPIDLSLAQTDELLRVADGFSVTGANFGNLLKNRNSMFVRPQERAFWQSRKGNVSGKPTWHTSNLLLAYAKQTFGDRFSLIGTGGVFSGEDALVKLALGADLVSLISGMVFQGPASIGMMVEYLEENYVKK